MAEQRWARSGSWRLRALVGTGAVVATLAVVGLVAGVADSPADRTVAAVGVLGAVVVTLAVVAAPGALVAGLLIVGGIVLVGVTATPARDAAVPVAGAVVLAFELAGWAVDLRSVAASDRAAVASRAAGIGVAVIGALGAGAALELATRIDGPRGGGALALALVPLAGAAAVVGWRLRAR